MSFFMSLTTTTQTAVIAPMIWRTTDLDNPIVAAGSTRAGESAYRIVVRRYPNSRFSDDFRVEVSRPAAPQHGMWKPYWTDIGQRHTTLALAIADAEDHRVHEIQVHTLARITQNVGRGSGQPSHHTPWGGADIETIFPDQTQQMPLRSIVSYSTPDHGGFHVAKFQNDRMPEHLRNAGCWYEEDCEWCKVALSFPALFTARELRQAQRAWLRWYCPEGVARHAAQMAKWQAEPENAEGEG